MATVAAAPASAATPPHTFTIGEAVRWVRPGMWGIKDVLPDGRIVLTPLDATARTHIAAHPDGRLALPRTERRYLRPIPTPTGTA